MNREEVLEILASPNGADKLLGGDAAAAFGPAVDLFLEDEAAACGFLCRAVKKPALKKALTERLGPGREALHRALVSPKPKMRKNAARLAGALGEAADVPALLLALEGEGTRFVRPSQLLALGEIGGEAAEAALSTYRIAPALPGEEKHAREEAAALAAAQKRCMRAGKHSFCGLKAPRLVELRTAENLWGSLGGELSALGMRPLSHFAGGLRLQAQDMGALYSCRSFYELLFPLGTVDLSRPDPALGEKMLALMEECHRGEGPYGYRIELRAGGADRGDRIRVLSRVLNGPKLFDSPSDYALELRLEPQGEGSPLFQAYAKLYTIPDGRFSYRKESLPASMHPATAAAVLRHVQGHLKPNARVLDPCCGSGTLLFEREKLGPCAALTGVDIAHRAVETARENALAGESRAKFIINDCLRFSAKRPYDEVISNLPFGNRVGSHEGNERLYFGLLNRLPAWLAPGGTAVLYTMEFTLLKKLLREQPRLRLISEDRTSAGGLTPGIFVIKCR